MSDLIDREELLSRFREEGAPPWVRAIVHALPVARCDNCKHSGEICHMTVGENSYHCVIAGRWNPASYSCNRWEATP